MVGAVEFAADAVDHTVGGAVASSADVVAVVNADEHLTSTVRQRCEAGRVMCADALSPDEGSRELALFKEVTHHDTELGGFSEWHTRGSASGAAVLQLLSTVHCRRLFPPSVDDLLPKMGEGVAHHRPRRWLWSDIASPLGGCDRADATLRAWTRSWTCAVIRERHGLAAIPHVQCHSEVCADAETMHEAIEPGTCDFVYSCNALDHVGDPVRAAENMADALKPGGIMFVQVYTRGIAGGLVAVCISSICSWIRTGGSCVRTATASRGRSSADGRTSG
ncbi:MAG: methyltransferase domain-containing protein [Vicinamibacterales bacterium]